MQRLTDKHLKSDTYLSWSWLLGCLSRWRRFLNQLLTEEKEKKRKLSVRKLKNVLTQLGQDEWQRNIAVRET